MTQKDHNIADVQSQTDQRRLAINKVGVRGIKHPVTVISDDGSKQHTSALFDMYVNLPHDQKGTHMSRFLEILNAQEIIVSAAGLATLLHTVTEKLNAENSFINVTFDYFIEKTAPVSKAKSLMDYLVSYRCEQIGSTTSINLELVVPITSLCPCSKKVADYGAHNQRSQITVNIAVDSNIEIDQIVSLIEKQASSELYGILKRSDEKFITERAYDNPKFVEDLIRDIASDLNNHPNISSFTVAAENFESIHNHSAYAVIDKP